MRYGSGRAGYIKRTWGKTTKNSDRPDEPLRNHENVRKPCPSASLAAVHLLWYACLGRLPPSRLELTSDLPTACQPGADLVSASPSLISYATPKPKPTSANAKPSDAELRKKLTPDPVPRDVRGRHRTAIPQRVLEQSSSPASTWMSSAANPCSVHWTNSRAAPVGRASRSHSSRTTSWCKPTIQPRDAARRGEGQGQQCPPRPRLR